MRDLDVESVEAAREMEEEVEEEEVEGREEEVLEEEVSFEIKGETPTTSHPSLVLTVTYDGSSGRALVKLYDPMNDQIYFWYDNTGHKPYLLTDVDPEDLVTRFPKVIAHKGFSHVELVEKFDALRNKKVVMIKIVARDPLSIGGRAEAIRELLPKTWESRIRYHLCYLFDNNVIPGMYYRIKDGKLVPVDVEIPEDIKKFIEKLYESEPEFREEADRWMPIFQAPLPSIKRLAIDIEVFTPRENRIPSPREAKYEIISIALAGSDGLKRVLLLRRSDLRLRPEELKHLRDDDVEIMFFDSEYEMLRELFKTMMQYPVIVTFNGDNFDLLYIYNRALKLGFRKQEIPIVVRRNEITVALGVHIDLYKFFNIKAIEVYAFGGKYRGLERTLDAIASTLVKMRKLERKPINEMSYVDLVNYNFRDAFLTLYLTTFDNELVMRLIVLLSRISKTPLDDLVRSQVSSWIKNMMYYEHRRRGWLIPEREDIISVKGQTVTKAIVKGKKYLGAIVLEPIPGVYPNVYVVDFASLYPSIIKRWNLSYETVRCADGEHVHNKPVPDLPHWVCTSRMGITSLVVGLLRDMRVHVYKRLSKAADSDQLRKYYNVIQSALKVLINASYGVFGAEIFPLYCPPVAELTTALGRYAMSSVVCKALELGLIPIYGDTDSLFIWNPDKEKLKELVSLVERELNIDIDVDKVYKLVALSSRKKNYIGVLQDGTVDIKGMVGKKRNTPDIAKEVFNEVLKMIASINSVLDVDDVLNKVRGLVRDCCDKLRRHEIPLNKLIIKVSLSKPLEHYKKTKPQHVKAALQLKQYGISLGPGDIVYLVKTKSKDGVKPVQLATIEDIDVDKYIEMLRTSLEQVLDSLGITFEEIVGTAKLLQ